MDTLTELAKDLRLLARARQEARKTKAPGWRSDVETWNYFSKQARRDFVSNLVFAV